MARYEFVEMNPQLLLVIDADATNALPIRASTHPSHDASGSVFFVV
ncbi:MAG TPA: hypothetical protein PLQ74_00215 [Pseudomonadota bacterium]|nr:hypothetical protein [Rhodanobacteraceae bacterium]MBP9154666.1 hypothetical protein [Xanthomonadales bacterium]HQW80269.1 hypothetical protein [Pseudomonadota bacterium]